MSVAKENDVTDGQGSVQPTAFQEWYKLPLEILESILLNLGKHDLLASRLVSHSWNDECLKVLRKSRFTQTLRTTFHYNIENYVLNVLGTTGRSQFVLPYHLNFKTHFANPDLTGHLNMKALTVLVEALCKMFGPKCVSELTLTAHYSSSKEDGLWEFLMLISPGLKKLDLKGFNVNANNILDSVEESKLKFPNLRKLSCNTSKCESGTRGAGQFYIYIIENSPHLEDLELTHPCDLDSWPLRFEVLKSLTLDKILEASNILNKLRNCPSPPILRELCFKHEGALAPVVHRILDMLSPTLKSLRIKKPQGEGSSAVPTLPLLPHLKHIGFEYNDSVRVNPKDINFNPGTLPSLTSVELPRGFFNSEEIGIEFPNVNELKLRISSYGNDAIYYKGVLEQFQQMCPKLLKFSIVNGRDQDLDLDCSSVKYLLDRFIQSNWSQNIKEIEMNGFHEDYFGQFLEGLEFRPGVVLKGCEKVQLKFIHSCSYNFLYDDWNWPPRSKNPPKLISIAKHLPHLRCIEISEHLFSHKDKNVWRQQIQEFTSHFPDVIVHLT